MINIYQLTIHLLPITIHTSSIINYHFNFDDSVTTDGMVSNPAHRYSSSAADNLYQVTVTVMDYDSAETSDTLFIFSP